MLAVAALSVDTLVQGRALPSLFGERSVLAPFDLSRRMPESIGNSASVLLDIFRRNVMPVTTGGGKTNPGGKPTKPGHTGPKGPAGPNDTPTVSDGPDGSPKGLGGEGTPDHTNTGSKTKYKKCKRMDGACTPVNYKRPDYLAKTAKARL